jgi:hypothetical protein
MILNHEETYHYSSIKDFLVNYPPARKVFQEITDIKILESKPHEIIDALDSEDEISAVKSILEQVDGQFIATQDYQGKINIIKLRDVKPLDYYMKPENLKKLRTKWGYTQVELGYKMGFDSIRRGYTVLEKEKGKVKIQPRDARILRYMDIFGDIDIK